MPFATVSMKCVQGVLNIVGIRLISLCRSTYLKYIVCVLYKLSLCAMYGKGDGGGEVEAFLFASMPLSLVVYQSFAHQ